MIQRPRGTRDFGPDEMETRRFFESLMRDVARTHGFREVSTPIFETTDLFVVKSGPGIVEEMYAFKDKGDREICLRPELTAPVIRFFVSDLTTYPRPLKMFYFGQCFRYERPQSGRYREFFQFGAELIGAPTPESDAEVIGLAASIIKKTGLKDYQIRVGHIGILRSLLTSAGVKTDDMLKILQKLDKKLYDEARPLMKEAGMNEEAMEDVIKTTQITGPMSVLNDFSGEAKEHLEQVFAVLNAYGLENVSVDLGVVRGLAYYTGMVFEADAPALGAEKQVCGGGSYSLSELFGGEKVFSSGFGIGFDRILLALQREGMTSPKTGIQAFVIPVNEKMRGRAFKIVADLRESGIVADIDLMRRSLAKNFKYADSIAARYAIIVGEKEEEAASVTLRNMGSGEQSLVKTEDLIERLRQ
ncbi:MAG TPA: histidine--tRNA ligase [Methanomassiliicoccales archaeon]|jgi:histidyl-tRNA synthetase